MERWFMTKNKISEIKQREAHPPKTDKEHGNGTLELTPNRIAEPPRPQQIPFFI